MSQRALWHASVMQPVIIESPFAGDTELHIAYARACMLHSFSLGEAPFASHLLYPQVLDDEDPEGRAQGIGAGYRIGMAAKARAVFYVDLGWSNGMHAAQEFWRHNGHGKSEWRHLPNFAKWLEGYRASHVMPEVRGKSPRFTIVDAPRPDDE